MEKVLEMTEEQETLVVVTGDHSHTMTIGGGYPTRGNPILGNYYMIVYIITLPSHFCIYLFNLAIKPIHILPLHYVIVYCNSK